MAEPNYYELYKALKADGAVQGDWTSFHQYVGAKGKQGYENRLNLYNALKADGAIQSKSYEEFQMKLFNGGQQSLKAAKQRQEPQSAAQRALQMISSDKPVTDYVRRPAEVNTAMQQPKPLKGPGKNASALVRGLYQQDDKQRALDREPYMPKQDNGDSAFVQNMKANDKVTDTIMKNGASKAIVGDTLNDKPMVDTGDEGANTYVTKTRNQFADEVSQSGRSIVDGSKEADVMVESMVNNEVFKNAENAARQKQKGNWGIDNEYGMNEVFYSRKANEQQSDEAITKRLGDALKENVMNYVANPNVAEQVRVESQRLGIAPEDYVKNAILPALYEKMAAKVPEKTLQRILPRGRFDYLMGGILDSALGTAGEILTKTKSQRMKRQEATEMTREGDNPYFQATMWDNAGRGAISYLADAPLFAATGVGANAAVGKVFGSVGKQAIRAANQTLLERIGTGVARGVIHGGVTGFQYGAINNVIQNYSTGEDTSLGGTLKAALKGGISEAVSFATMEGMGGVVGAFGRGMGLTGAERTFGQKAKGIGKKLTFETVKTGMEGIGMATGGVASDKVASWIEGRDSKGFTTEGTLESCASAVIFKLMHAKEAFKNHGNGAKKGNDESGNVAKRYLDKVKSNLYGMMYSENARSELNGQVFSKSEMWQLRNAGEKAGMDVSGTFVGFADKTKKPTQQGDGSKEAATYYQSIMNDPTISWDTKAKFTTLVMGTMPSARPMADFVTFTTEKLGGNEAGYEKYINEYSADGKLLSKTPYDSISERRAEEYKIKANCADQVMWNALGVVVGQDMNETNLQNGFFKKQLEENDYYEDDVDTLVYGMGQQGSAEYNAYKEYVTQNGRMASILQGVAERHGMTVEDVYKALQKEPMKRTDSEQKAMVDLRKTAIDAAFPKDKVHEEQSRQDGKDVAEENGLGTDKPNPQAVTQELNNLKQAEAELEAMMQNDDTFAENFKNLQGQGLTTPQIYEWMVNNGLTEEQLAPFARYINAVSRVQGMQKATSQAIDQHVQAFVTDWTYHGEMNGEKKDGDSALWVQDKDGRALLVGSGDVSYDANDGHCKDGDMLVCFDPNTGEVVYVKANDTTLMQTQTKDELAADERRRIENINNAPYQQAAQEQAAEEAAKAQQQGGGKPADATATQQGTEGQGQTPQATAGGAAPAQQQETKPARKFADGSDVPMTKDSKGRDVPDYDNMTAEQAAELLSQDFGESAEKVAEGMASKAQKELEKAQKMKVDYDGDINDIKEQEEAKQKAMDAAKKKMEHADGIRKALTAKKVEKTVEGNKTPSDGANEADPAVKKRYDDSKKIIGRKGSITLANGQKIKGTYVYGETSGLTPSHDPTNNFAQSEGFPVNADGTSANSRSYKDANARAYTIGIGNGFNGLALQNVPVVQDGVVLSGNGTTMAKKLAERNGKDGKYYEALAENAGSFGLNADDIAKAGFKGLVYFVPDEKMPLTSDTFDIFNKRTEKNEGNKDTAVKLAKTLSAEDVGAIIAEIEGKDGSGTLEAFFNNPSAINDLMRTLMKKGVIGQNEVGALMEGENRLSPQGREFVKNLLLGSVFSPETIEMMGEGSSLKNRVVTAIRPVLRNMKLGAYSLKDEIDEAVRLMCEARTSRMSVDDLLRQGDFVRGNARDRYPSISQLMALTLDGKVDDFRNLLDDYNRQAAARNTGEADVFGDAPTKEELIKEFLDYKKWKDYDKRGENPEGEGGHDVQGLQESQPGTPGGDGGKQPLGGGQQPSEAEKQKKVSEVLKALAKDITERAVGAADVVTDEDIAEERLREAAENGDDISYSKREKPAPQHTIKVYKLMRLGNDGKLYPLFIDATNPTELGVWYDADSPDLSMLKGLPSGVHLVDAKSKKTVSLEQFYKEHPDLFKRGLSKYPSKEALTWAAENGMRFMYIEDTEKGQKRFGGEKRKYWNLGINGSGGVSPFSMRPGWHAASLPTMRQIGKGKDKNLRDDRFVWVEGEVSSDVDYSAEAESNPDKDLPDRIPIDGYYMKATNADKSKSQADRVGWYVAGSFKANRIISDKEAHSVIDKWNKEHPNLPVEYDYERESGKVFNADTMRLEDDEKKASPETVAPPASRDNASVVPSDAVAKIQKRLDTIKEIYKKSSNKTRGFITDVSRELGLTKHEASNYGTFRTSDGREFTIRISNHNAKVSLFDKNEEQEGISIVISGLRNRGLIKDGNAHVVEVFYSKKAIERSKGKPLVDIIDSLKDTIVTGEYKDKTGLAIPEEANGGRKYFKTKDGEVYGFTDGKKIYLDLKKMKADTPLHEYGHLWVAALQRLNPKEWENVKGLFDQVEGLKEEIQKAYPELEGDDLYEEMITTYSGRKGAEKLEAEAKRIAAEEGKELEDSAKAKGFIDKVRDALKRYWKGVADLLHIKFTNADEVADKMLADWADGVDPRKLEGMNEDELEHNRMSEPEEKSESITITYGKDGERTFSAEEADLAKKIFAANPEKPITELQRKLRIGYNTAIALAKELGWQEKPTFMPKTPEPSNPIEKAAEDYKKEHPLTDEEVSNTTVFDDLPEDQKQYCIDAALDYLHGEDTSAISEAYYRNIYEKRGAKKPEPKPTEPSKTEPSADPMEGLKKAASEYSEPKTEAKSKPKAEKKPQTRKEIEAERDAADNAFESFMKELQKKRMGQLNSGFIDQNLIEAAPTMFSLAAKCAYTRIKLGMYDAKEVIKDLKNRFKEAFEGFDKKDVDLFYSQIMGQKWKDGDQRMSLSDWAEHYRKLSPEHQDKLVGDSKTAEERKQREESFISNLKMIMGGRKVDGIRELRQLAKELGLEGVKDTDLQELAETAVVSRARDIANSKAMSPERKFAEIKKLYANQPSLNMRDSDRIRHQQYSTPAPYAYLADMYVNGNGSKEIKSALEPSAGNGMLTIGLPMDKVHVNDIDEARLMNLHRQGFKTITSQDGTQPFSDKDVDVVVTNPPFGSATPKDYDGYKISSLEGQMAINALDSMKDDGRAAIIIGGKTEYAKNGSLNPKDKAFLGYLYSHYNVEDVINVDGSLYAKQGTSYPTRIILINGRRLDENSFPPVKDKARAETVKDYDELYKRINDDLLRSRGLDSSNRREVRGAESESDKRGSINPDEKGVRGRDGGRKREDKGVSSGLSGESAVSGSNDELGNGRGANGEPDGRLSDGGTGTDSAGSETSKREGRENISNRTDGGQLHQPGGAGRNDAQRSSDESHRVEEKTFEEKKSEVKRGLSTEKVNYASKSNNPFTLQSVMPADQQEAVNKNLAKLGDADQFLVDELGYNDKDDLYKHLAAEQIDSVALAIHQAKQGNGFIIGDMTGIGKGRQASSLIRYAKKQGQIPVYFTKTAGLLSDVYRDLVDVGSPDLRPFVFGSDKEANITDSDGNLVYKLPTDKEKDRVISYINRYGKLPKEYDYILTTYSQVSNGVYEFDDNGNKKERKPKNGFTSSHYKGQERRDAIEKVIENGYLILDESHTAGGDSGQGNYFQHIIQKAKSVTFFSATFAKRPDNMPIYALRTAMNQGGLKPSELIDAVKRGGATLQEIMSKTLTESGQMIRRERDMTGVTIDWKSIDDPVVVSEQREQYDNIIGLFNDIINFQKSYVIPYIDSRNEELAAIQSSMGLRKGTESLGIKSTPFASKAFNTVQQVLLSLKAKEAARRAIDYLKQDIKPVIALSNTNESQSGEIKENVEVEEPDLSTSLKKGLAGTLRYTTKNSKNKEENGDIKLEDLGSEGVEAYYALMKKIESASTGLALSPIDVIKNELQKAGYKVGELTGRKSEFIYNENGSVTKVKRTGTDKKKLARQFNDGTIDALILNKSASTGISLHASNKFGDQRKRVMIVAQQQLDVNDEVQMRGRIDRTGQVSRGAYEYIVSQIPAEQRLLMMFKAKLKSLDANTTASQKSKFNEMDVADITNKYGDKIVREYAAEHLDIYAKMADPFNWEKDGIDLSQIDPQKLINSKGGRNGEYEPGADASKFLGRMALLKVEEQEKMLSEISDLYTNEINRLNEMGENDLEITELPLKAKTVGKEVWKEGSEPNGDNAFADNTYIEKVNMAILKKPMKAEEVKKAQEGLTGGRSWDEYRDEKRASIKQYFDEKIAGETERLEQRAQKIAQKAADKYKKEAKKNQEQNQFTDEQIEKNAQFQYDNIYKQEKEKAATAIKNIKTKQEAFERVLDTFNTEDAYVLPSDMNNPNEMSAFGNSYGRLIDIKITDNYSPTASTVSFATLDGRRKITFPISGMVGSGDRKADVISSIYRLTKQAEGMSDKQLHVLNMDVNNWDRLVSNESRKDGYIITGNLMQALIDTKSQGLGGQLIKYTTDTGEVKTGILMPDRFKPTDASTDAPISAKADDFIQGKVDDLTSKDGDVKLSSVSTWRGTTIELRVPKSTKRGGKYFLDDKLRSLVDGNDFSTKGNSMSATISSYENVRSVLKRLSELGVRVKEERKEGTHFRTGNTASSTPSVPSSIVADNVAKVSEKVGSKVNMVNSPEEVTNPAVKERLNKGENVTGWYDEKTGEVYLYMPNIHDTYTAEKTIWHETVGHKGMRGLVGDENYRKFLREVWYSLDEPGNERLKALVEEEMKYNPLDYENAVEEGIARMAEDGRGEPGLWNRLKQKVTDLLHEVGYRVAPNTKDVKYLLWLAKNRQKHPNDLTWKMREEAVRYHLEKDDTPSVHVENGLMRTNDGRIGRLDELPRKEYDEVTDGEIHFRTSPSTATALDRYHKALASHGYMFTESFMDNMASLKELMKAMEPETKDVADIKSSENAYILQNTMQGAMADKADRFERDVMEPLDKAMAGVLDAFEGKDDDEKIRNFNLYMITKHGLERNRVLFVRDSVNELRKNDDTKDDADSLQKQWNAEKKDLGERLRKGQLTLDKYYSEMDEWIRNNVDATYKAGEHDYSGMHALQGIEKDKDPYDDASAVASVMDKEASMESVKKGSVNDFWDKVQNATRFSIQSDYDNGLISKELKEHVDGMFDWYVPLRKYDEATAEDTYGYITEKGDPKNYIGGTLMKAKGHKYLSEANVLAMIGAMGNRAISNGGRNAVKQAFARFVRSHSDSGLVTETSVWYVEDPQTKTVTERYPDIPEDATPDEVSQIVKDFNDEMQKLKEQGLAKKQNRSGSIGYRFEKKADKSQHLVDVMIAGRKHTFVINGNPRAAQALNGLLENDSKKSLVAKSLSKATRFMAQMCTSFNPEFTLRNILRDAEFASSNIAAKEGAAYTGKWMEYYTKYMGKGFMSTSIKDFSGTTGLGLYNKYRNGTLDMNDKTQKYFKEFMENGGETGWVQVLNFDDWKEKYKEDIGRERSKTKKAGNIMRDFLFGNIENMNEVAENAARFATYCASRESGRSKVRSAYDAKEVSTNFNRHGSGSAINSFKHGEESTFKNGIKGNYGFWSSYFRNYSMFFNAGIQSTNLLKNNLKNNSVGTMATMMSVPFGLGLIAAAVNNMLISSEDDNERNGVKDPYGELPDYIRRNNLCIYTGKGQFVTIPLAVELRAFYGLGDLAAGMTFSPNIKGTKNVYLDAAGCLSQLVPVMDFLNSSSDIEDIPEDALKAIAPTSFVPFLEWALNSDWKGASIERRGDWNKNAPAWQRAYSNTPEGLIELNKKVNAMTNDVAEGNENMKGNDVLDAMTNPSMLQHFYESYGGGALTFGERFIGLLKKGKETEISNIPFMRSFYYKPNERTSLQRTKSRWYGYKAEMEKTIDNVSRLERKNVPAVERMRNLSDLNKFRQSAEAEKVNVIEATDKQLKRWNKLRDMAPDDDSRKNANANIDRIITDAVDTLDRLSE